MSRASDFAPHSPATKKRQKMCAAGASPQSGHEGTDSALECLSSADPSDSFECDLFETESGFRCACLCQDEALFFFHEIFVHRLYYQHGLELCRGATVLDVGANIGLFAMFCCAEQKDVTVHAFEPVPEACNLLRLNTRRSQLKSGLVLAHEFALSDGPGHVPYVFFAEAPGESTANPVERASLQSLLHSEAVLGEYGRLLLEHGVDTDTATQMVSERASTGGDDVPTVTEARVWRTERLSTLFNVGEALEGVTQVSLLKIDVEGDELKVLRGVDKDHWRFIEQVVVEVRDVDGRLDHVQQILRTAGFVVYTERQTPKIADRKSVV